MGPSLMSLSLPTEAKWPREPSEGSGYASSVGAATVSLRSSLPEELARAAL